MLSCPWQSFTPDQLYFCEAEICGWVRQPANAWSSFAIIFVGLLVIYLTKVKKQNYLSLFGWILVFLGVGTFLYHASTALLGGVLDLAGMSFMVFFLLVTSLLRLYPIERKKLVLLFLLGSLMMASLHAIKPNLATPIFAILALIAFYLETQVWIKERGIRGITYLVIFAAFILLALIAWYLDAAKLVCDPTSHLLQGHAIWHILSGVAFFFLYLYLSKASLPGGKLLC